MSVDGCNELDKHDSCGPLGDIVEELGRRGLKRIRGLPLEDEDEQYQGSGPVQVVSESLPVNWRDAKEPFERELSYSRASAVK